LHNSVDAVGVPSLHGVSKKKDPDPVYRNPPGIVSSMETDMLMMVPVLIFQYKDASSEAVNPIGLKVPGPT